MAAILFWPQCINGKNMYIFHHFWPQCINGTMMYIFHNLLPQCMNGTMMYISIISGLSVLMAQRCIFLAATKQLYKWYFPSVCPSVRLSVCPSVRLSHLFDYVPIIVSSCNFQELLPMTKVRSMQKVKVRGQRSRSQRSQPNLTVSGL